MPFLETQRRLEREPLKVEAVTPLLTKHTPMENSKSPGRLQHQSEGVVKRHNALDASVLKLGKIHQRFWNYGSVLWRRRCSLKLSWKELLCRPPTTRVTDNVLASGYKPWHLGSEPRPPPTLHYTPGPWVPREAGCTHLHQMLGSPEPWVNELQPQEKCSLRLVKEQ